MFLPIEPTNPHAPRKLQLAEPSTHPRAKPDVARFTSSDAGSPRHVIEQASAQDFPFPSMFQNGSATPHLHTWTGAPVGMIPRLSPYPAPFCLDRGGALIQRRTPPSPALAPTSHTSNRITGRRDTQTTKEDGCTDTTP